MHLWDLSEVCSQTPGANQEKKFSALFVAVDESERNDDISYGSKCIYA